MLKKENIVRVRFMDRLRSFVFFHVQGGYQEFHRQFFSMIRDKQCKKTQSYFVRHIDSICDKIFLYMYDSLIIKMSNRIDNHIHQVERMLLNDQYFLHQDRIMQMQFALYLLLERTLILEEIRAILKYQYEKYKKSNPIIERPIQYIKKTLKPLYQSKAIKQLVQFLREKRIYFAVERTLANDLEKYKDKNKEFKQHIINEIIKYASEHKQNIHTVMKNLSPPNKTNNNHPMYLNNHPMYLNNHHESDDGHESDDDMMPLKDGGDSDDDMMRQGSDDDMMNSKYGQGTDDSGDSDDDMMHLKNGGNSDDDMMRQDSDTDDGDSDTDGDMNNDDKYF